MKAFIPLLGESNLSLREGRIKIDNITLPLFAGMRESEPFGSDKNMCDLFLLAHNLGVNADTWAHGKKSK